MSGHQFNLRVARQSDADAVTAVLTSAYPGLMARDYDPAILAATLPAMTVANPRLLASGTYYVQEVRGSLIVACGGWTHEEPRTNRVENGVAHLRHFGTHVEWIRMGLGAGIFQRCREEARAARVHTFRCFATLGAEPFYASLGFQTVERIDLAIGSGVKLPSIIMVWTDRSTVAALKA
jgi:GNAT superfamily N-acetyltransferase